MKYRLFFLMLSIIGAIISTDAFQKEFKNFIQDLSPNIKEQIEFVQDFLKDLGVDNDPTKNIFHQAYKDTTRFESGEIKYIYNLIGNKREGETLEFETNGKLIMRWCYTNDSLDGISTQYYNNGNYAHWIYSSDRLVKGEVFYDNGVKEADYFYVDNMRQGYSYRYYRSGTITTTWLYKDDNITESYGFFETGEKKYRYNYINSVLNDTTIEYDINGNEIIYWVYKDGYLNGISEEYYTNGNIKGRWEYKNHLLHGTSQEFNKKGDLINTWEYNEGELLN